MVYNCFELRDASNVMLLSSLLFIDHDAMAPSVIAPFFDDFHVYPNRPFMLYVLKVKQDNSVHPSPLTSSCITNHARVLTGVSTSKFRLRRRVLF